MALGATLKVKMDTSAVRRGLASIRGMFTRLGATLRGLGGVMRKSLVPLIGLGAGVALGAKKLAEYGAELKKTSVQTGVSIRDVLAFREAMRLAGVEISDDADLLSDFQEKLEDAKMDAGTFKEGIHPLGLRLSDLDNMTPIEQLEKFLQAINDSDLDIQKLNHVIDKAFGGMGFALMALAKDYKNFMEEARASTDQLATSLEGGLLENLVDTNKEMIKATTQLKGLGLALITELPIDEIVGLIKEAAAELTKFLTAEGSLKKRIGGLIATLGEQLALGFLRISKAIGGQLWQGIKAGMTTDFKSGVKKSGAVGISVETMMKLYSPLTEIILRFLTGGLGSDVKPILEKQAKILERIERKEGAVFA